MADSKKYNGSSWEHSLRKLTTATDTFTTLPVDIYADGNNATVGLKGNTVQSGTPTPDNPIMPQGTGERTAQLWDISSWNGATAQRGTLERVTNGYKLTATSADAYTMTYGSGAYSYSVISGSEYTLSWTVDNPQIYGVVYIFTGTSVADTPLTTAVASSGSKTFTVPSGHNYVAFRLGVSNIGDEITYTNVMLNTGSTAKPFEPYGYKIPISSANTTTPIYLGEVQTTRRVKKLVLTGNEIILRDREREGSWRFFTDRLISAKGSAAICSHFENIGTDGVNNSDNIGFSIFNNAQFGCRCPKSIADTATDFKSYLAAQYANGTPVTVWYVLATPETAVVNEPLRKIGDYADTVSGITIPTIIGKDTFDVETTLKPSEVSLAYTGWHDATVKEWDGSQWS